jgi:hypothetical protein
MSDVSNGSRDALGAEILDVQQPSADPAEAPQAPMAPTTGRGGSEHALAAGPGIIRCSVTTKAGKPCVNRAGVGGRCVVHTQDEAVKAMVQAGRAAGGRAPRVRAGLDLDAPDAIRLDTVEGAVALLEAVVRAVAVNRISGTQAQAITGAVRIALQAQEQVTAAQLAELQAKLDALTVEAPRGRRPLLELPRG